MAEQKKYKLSTHELGLLCIQIWQSGAGKMEFDSPEAALKYFTMIAETFAAHGCWEEVKE